MKLNELNCSISRITKLNHFSYLLLVVASSRQIIIIILFNYIDFSELNFRILALSLSQSLFRSLAQVKNAYAVTGTDV